jgi:hypothetical protein
VSTDDSDQNGDKLLRLLEDNQIDLTVAEGLRLVIALRKIKDPSDRRVLIELAAVHLQERYDPLKPALDRRFTYGSVASTFPLELEEISRGLRPTPSGG